MSNSSDTEIDQESQFNAELVEWQVEQHNESVRVECEFRYKLAKENLLHARNTLRTTKLQLKQATFAVNWKKNKNIEDDHGQDYELLYHQDDDDIDSMEFEEQMVNTLYEAQFPTRLCSTCGHGCNNMCVDTDG